MTNHIQQLSFAPRRISCTAFRFDVICTSVKRRKPCGSCASGSGDGTVARVRGVRETVWGVPETEARACDAKDPRFCLSNAFEAPSGDAEDRLNLGVQAGDDALDWGERHLSAALGSLSLDREREESNAGKIRAPTRGVLASSGLLPTRPLRPRLEFSALGVINTLELEFKRVRLEFRDARLEC